jgi:hypothetical protein
MALGIALVLAVSVAHCLIIDPAGVRITVIEQNEFGVYDTTRPMVTYCARNFDGTWTIRGYSGHDYYSTIVPAPPRGKVIEPASTYKVDTAEIDSIIKIQKERKNGKRKTIE